MRVLLLVLTSVAALNAQSTTTMTADTPQLSLQAIVEPEVTTPNES